MKTSSLQKSASNGSVFGIIIIFLALIGFTDIVSGLIQKIGGNESGLSGIPSTWSLLVFLGFVGIWNGWRAAGLSWKTTLTLKSALINGLAAGFVTGVLVLTYVLVVGTINQTGVNMRVYLSALSSDSVNFFLFGQSPFIGGLFHLVYSTVTALAGALLAFGAGRSSQKVKEWRTTAMLWSQKTWLGKLQSSPYISYVLMGVVLL